MLLIIPSFFLYTYRAVGFFFFFRAEDGIRYPLVTGVQTCALPISRTWSRSTAATRPMQACGLPTFSENAASGAGCRPALAGRRPACPPRAAGAGQRNPHRRSAVGVLLGRELPADNLAGERLGCRA